MARPMLACVAVVALGLCAGGAWGTPVLDGTVNLGEYAFITTDDPNDNDAGVYETGLDIDTVEMTVEPNDLYVAVTTDTAFDYDGSDANSWGQTWVRMRFYENSVNETPKHSMVLMTLGDPNSFMLWMDGGIKVEGTHYWAKLGDALEFRIDRSQLIPDVGDEFAFDMHLDDTGGDMDDYVWGYVPEPAAVGLMSLAAVAMLRRRRSR